MQKYLLTVLIKDSLKDDERKELLSSVTKNFDNLIKEDLWGQRSLAYPIKKQDRAFYVHLEFESEPQKVPTLDKSLKLNEDILRYLLVKATNIKKQITKKEGKKFKGEENKEEREEVKEKDEVAAAAA